jgi:FAD/FMN-containing dehydrogenase
VFPTSDSAALYDRVVEAVEDEVQALAGSFSAEHGVGLSKLPSMQRRKDPVALEVMRAVKAALDPENRMNPGKVIPAKG